ncbi:MAG: hypothetical protein ACPF9D_10125 [Owenweeksia sp.]
MMKLMVVALMAVAMVQACKQVDNHEDKMALVMANTDSIQNINALLKEKYESIAKENMMAANTDVKTDSAQAVTMTGYQEKLQQQKTSIEEVDNMIADFERFETTHQAGDHATMDTNEVKDILRMQEEALNKQNEIMEELDHIQSDMESANEGNDLTAKEEESAI